MNMNNTTNKPTKIALLFLINFFFLVSMTNAQKVYELNEINQIPYINKSDMKTIAYSLFELYKTEIKSPEKLSNSDLIEVKVRCFVLINSNLILQYDSLIGLNYTSMHQIDLEKNDKIFFNLFFNENGSIDISDNLNVISCRTDNIENFVRNSAFALNLSLPDSLINKLKKINLETVAAIDINSLNNELKPVKIKIPFKVAFYERPSEKITGTVEKRGERVGFNFNYLNEDEKNQIIKIIETKTDLMQYKKGLFEFVLKRRIFEYYITFCFDWQMYYSSQPTDIRINSIELETFTGQGKK
jgi:hypothetical protein